MSFDKLLAQFVVTVLAVVIGLLIYDRLKPAPDPMQSPVLSADLQTEKVMVDRSGLRAEVVAISSQIKVAIAEWYLTTGQWPESLSALGLGEPASFRGQWISEVRLLPAGTIALQRDPAAGGGQLQLRPKLIGSQFTWECVSDWDDAELIQPGCRADA